MRLFIAIEFPEMVRDDLGVWAELLARQIPDPDRRLHWVKKEQFHLTLRFLGETPDNQIPRLDEILRLTAKEHHSFFLSLAKIGHFSGRVVWLGVEQGKDEMKPLAESISKAFQGIGSARETRQFQGHVTLARSKKNPGTLRLADLPTALAQKVCGPFPVSHISLIQSTLTPSGSEYRTLERFALNS